MRPVLLLLLVALAACGRPDVTGMERCDTAFRETWSASGCRWVSDDVDTAGHLLVAAGVITDAEWHDVVAGNDLVVAADDNFAGPYGDASGFTGDGWLEIGESHLALLHEVLHVVDVHHGVLNTAEHPDWSSRGYFGLDDVFGSSFGVVDVGTCRLAPPTDEQLAGLRAAGVDVDAYWARVVRLRDRVCQ